jgi:hypothetical protein
MGCELLHGAEASPRKLVNATSTNIASGRFRALAGLMLLLAGCAGNPAANPDRHFSGLRDIVTSLPPGGTLDLFLVHGMRAYSDQTYDDVIAAINERMPIEQDGTPTRTDLVTTDVPTVTLDGVPVFSADNWAMFEPYVVVARYLTKDHQHHINFYKLNYWPALALMKCLFIISPDTLVVGSSDRAKFCTSKPWNATVNSRLSSAPDWGNEWIKTEIVEWGLADAAIATSDFRRVLHRTVREALGMALNAARAREGIQEDATDDVGDKELEQFRQKDRTRFAFITQSLGSYVVHDSLYATDDPARSHVESIAPYVVICGATQVHMFANQLALLRFSELQVADGKSPKRTESEAARGEKPGRSHFFRGCQNQNGAGSAKRGTEFAAQQVVAYHDPNDLLTYYTSDRPGYIGEKNVDTTNVVAPFTGTIVPFLLADPMKAHTGQATSRVIVDSVVCGHEPGNWKPCGVSR